MDAKKLRELCDELFSKRSSLLSMWQEIAENFYPQRADFTINRDLGSDFAGGLTTSYPILCARELSDSMSTMLRPSAKPWFHIGLGDPDREDNDTKRYLERAEGIQRRAMYDPVALFTNAEKNGDNDFTNFGQYAESVEINWKSKRGPHLLYRCHHLRDMAWKENELGQLCVKVRKWKPTVRDLISLFGTDRLDPAIISLNNQNRIFDEVSCYHIVCDMEMYDGQLHENDRGRERFERVSLYYDIEHDKLIYAAPIHGQHYIIPRWQTVSGSQYAFSPAVVAALPEARLIQAMAYTLLEAGEKMVNPPLVAMTDVLRSDVDIQSGAINWVDSEYDERLGPALRHLEAEYHGMPIGIEMQRDSRALLMQAFFLNKLKPFTPTSDPNMTAFQAGQIVAQYIRDALPLFEPMEQQRNGAVCEETFDLLMRGNAFGSPLDLPRRLQGVQRQDVRFHFETPLHDAIEQMKGQKWLEGKALIADALALDRSAASLLDTKVALRDALKGIGYPAKWVRSEEDVKKAEQQAEKQAQSQALGAQVLQGSEAAANLAAAQKSTAEARAMGQGA